MRLLMTSLGAWDTIQAGQKQQHQLTFPLAILQAVLTDAGLPVADCWEGDERPAGPWGVLLVSAMDSRHFWRIPQFLRDARCPVLATDRGESDPIVVMGGQAATAPAPVEELVDVVFVGEAEAGAAELVHVLSGPGTRAERLSRAAALPGCWVPSEHYGTGHVVHQVWAEDIGVTLRERLWVNHRRIHRVEIARGCKSRCGFCALGWRSPYRENDAQAIADSLARTSEMGVNEVHLSAGDAEGHSAIVQIREAVQAHGMRDHGWTGRLDTMRDCSVSAGKMFAFGIEGASHRLRAAVGKPRLTDDYILQEMGAYWAAGGRRAMWHLIGGLPGEGRADVEEFAALLSALARVARGVGEPLQLEIGRQPFGPLPHTPMQWFRPGISTDAIGQVVQRSAREPGLGLTDKAGQRPGQALLNTLVMRGGREVTPLVLRGAPTLPEAEIAARHAFARVCRDAGLRADRYLGDWDTDEPTPWSHVRSMADHDTLVRAYRAILRRISE